MYESKFIKPLTAELALRVGQNLRLEDRREAEETTGYCAEAVYGCFVLRPAQSTHIHLYEKRNAG